MTVALSTRNPWMLVASKAVFLENCLAVITWIFNGSSIECHEKNHQPFSLSGVRFGSRAIQITYAELRSTQMTSVVNLACKQEINYSHLHS